MIKKNTNVINRNENLDCYSTNRVYVDIDERVNNHQDNKILNDVIHHEIHTLYDEDVDKVLIVLWVRKDCSKVDVTYKETDTNFEFNKYVNIKRNKTKNVWVNNVCVIFDID